MDEIFLAVQARLMAQVLELRQVDMDWGQLETQEETYPLDFPCVLIDTTDVQWEDSGVLIQPGTVTLRVKVAVSMPIDTHGTSGSASSSIAALTVANDVHLALNRFKSLGFSRLIRNQTRRINLPGGIKVTEIDYRVGVMG